MHDIVVENLVAERGAFTVSQDKGRQEIRDVQNVYSLNLITMVADIIQQHYSQVSVTHDAT